jgi:acetylornithine deacetylase/succinyl-diaminopimelate desuccinylase-like protein
MVCDLLPLARRMIAIDTRSALSNLELIEFLIPLCRLAGLETSLQEETRDGVRQYNLLASRRPLDSSTLLLATHTDTVPPGNPSLWTATGGDPFALTERGGLLYGLGSADVKLDLLCKLIVLESLRDVELRDNVALAATCGEETGRYGADLLVRELQARDRDSVPGRVLVGEPTGLRPGTAHKGYVEFRTEGSDPAPQPLPPLPCWRLVFAGVAAHSSQPHRGASANGACLDALAALTARTVRSGSALAIASVRGGDVVNKVAAECEAVLSAAEAPEPSELLAPAAAAAGVRCTTEPARVLDGACWSPDLARLLLAVHSLTRDLEARLRACEAPGFDPPYGTVNNGLVRLEQAHLSYVVDVRRVPSNPPGQLAAELLDAHETALRSLEGIGAPHSETLRLRTERLLDSPPFGAAPKSPLLAALMVELGVRGLPLEPEFKSGTTEAPVYQKAGMDTVIFGPGQAAGNIHKPNEHISLADLYRCVDIYRDVVLRSCGG